MEDFSTVPRGHHVTENAMSLSRISYKTPRACGAGTETLCRMHAVFLTQMTLRNTENGESPQSLPIKNFQDEAWTEQPYRPK